MPATTLTHSQKAQRLLIASSLLLALLLAVIGFVWWSDRQSISPSTDIQVTAQRLRIERPGFAPMTLQRQVDDQWRIVEPCELPVNAQRLQPLLAALQPSAHSYASLEVDLDAAGLIQPEAILYFDEQHMSLGDTDLSGERRYLQRGDRVEFVPEWVLPLINGGLSALAVPEIFPQGLDSIRLVSTASVDGAASEPDVGAEADDAQSDDALSQWRALTAQQIVAWPLPYNEPALGSQQLTAVAAGQRLSFTLHDFQRFAAVRFENAACAYIIARSTVPDNVFP